MCASIISAAFSKLDDMKMTAAPHGKLEADTTLELGRAYLIQMKADWALRGRSFTAPR